MKIAYCDCYSGISGDMLLGALIDAGFSLDDLQEGLAGLGLDQAYQLKAQETHKGSLRATQFTVILTGKGPVYHRDLRGISEIIQGSRLPQKVIEQSLAIFQRLAEAEGRVHGIAVEQVHFHEVGAIDAIVDICGAALGLHQLGIEKLYAAALPLGGGQVKSAHGEIPLPAPATLELLASVNAPIYSRQTEMELVTPTGAAILASLAEFNQPEMVLQRIGTGAGERALPWPNVLRLWIGEGRAEQYSGLRLLETNIDDMNPEFYGHVMALLFEAGALDVYLTPVYMKKNRPGTMLSVIARQENEEQLARLILLETSTFGVRVQPLRRYEAGRSIAMVSTVYGQVPVKLKIVEGKAVSATPEYDICSQLALQHQAPLATVFNAALEAGRVYILGHSTETES
jgi:pyridinium-3,5-bisthiocarboxylic acid mononucleotide nickel chelatase